MIKYEIFQEVAAFAEKAAFKGDTRKWLELACCYFYEHSDILKILFRYRTDDDFVLFLNERFNEQYPNLINKGYFRWTDVHCFSIVDCRRHYSIGDVTFIIDQEEKTNGI